MARVDLLTRGRLPAGIVPVLQTPFDQQGELDFAGLERLIEDAIAGGAAGFLAPAVASEVDCLSGEERVRLVRFIARTVGGCLPLLVGASSEEVEESRAFARLAEEVGASAWLMAVPEALYHRRAEIPAFFQAVAAGCRLPFVIQDLQWTGPGLSLEDIGKLKQALPTLAGIKIETVPAGPKYTEVRQAFGADFYIAGGWAVPQLIEALDRGVDAIIPEASMVRVYAAIYRMYRGGNRQGALELFRRLLPVLAFTNQEIGVSIAFFKLLLVRLGVFRHETMRRQGFRWDTYNRRIADELVELYRSLEGELEQAR